MPTTDQQNSETVKKEKREYRVIWEREGMSQKQRRFAKSESATRWLSLLTSPKPWEAFGLQPDDYACCSGMECGCGGATHEKVFMEKRKTLPKIISAKIESRKVGLWE